MFQSTRDRQRAAPFLEERERYLNYLIGQGVRPHRVRSVASMLLNIVRLMELKVLRSVDAVELRRISERWLTDTVARRTRKPGPTSIESVTYIAMKWFDFLGLLHKPERPTDAVVVPFLRFLSEKRGLSKLTMQGCRCKITLFLTWCANRQLSLSSVTAQNVDEFLEFKRTAGCKPRTVAGFSYALRTFFLYTDIERLTQQGLAKIVVRPKIPRNEQASKGPKWKDVRRVLDAKVIDTPADLRGAAIFSLCAIYAIRRIEIVRFKLTDLDWDNELLTVKRAKNGRIQRLPLNFEVGEAILRWLRFGRPRCSSRSLFVTLRPPYREIDPSMLWTIIASRLKSVGVRSEHYGANCLRHACATYLLNRGSPLRDIADFLGHRGMKSVSIYAKHDIRSLRKVADLKFSGLI